MRNHVVSISDALPCTLCPACLVCAAASQCTLCIIVECPLLFHLWFHGWAIQFLSTHTSLQHFVFLCCLVCFVHFIHFHHGVSAYRLSSICFCAACGMSTCKPPCGRDPSSANPSREDLLPLPVWLSSSLWSTSPLCQRLAGCAGRARTILHCIPHYTSLMHINSLPLLHSFTVLNMKR